MGTTRTNGHTGCSSCPVPAESSVMLLQGYFSVPLWSSDADVGKASVVLVDVALVILTNTESIMMFNSNDHTDDVHEPTGLNTEPPVYTSTSTNNSWDWIGPGLDKFLDVATSVFSPSSPSKNWSVGSDLVDAFPGTVPRRIPCRLGF